MGGTIAWGAVFVATVIVARIILDRTQRTSTNPMLTRTAVLIGVALLPGAMAVRSLMGSGMAVAQSPAAAFAVGVFVVGAAGVVALVMAPFIVEFGAHLGAWMALGAPSERSMKARKSFDRAKAFVHKQDFEAAVAEYRAELAKDPTQAHGYKELADVLEKLDRLDEAISELEKALPNVEDAEERAFMKLRVVDLHDRRGRMDVARDLLAQMERESWPQRIAKAIQTRRQRLSS